MEIKKLQNFKIELVREIANKNEIIASILVVDILALNVLVAIDQAKRQYKGWRPRSQI